MLIKELVKQLIESAKEFRLAEGLTAANSYAMRHDCLGHCLAPMLGIDLPLEVLGREYILPSTNGESIAFYTQAKVEGKGGAAARADLVSVYGEEWVSWYTQQLDLVPPGLAKELNKTL
jgi:hypothetical protein